MTAAIHRDENRLLCHIIPEHVFSSSSDLFLNQTSAGHIQHAGADNLGINAVIGVGASLPLACQNIRDDDSKEVSAISPISASSLK